MDKFTLRIHVEITQENQHGAALRIVEDIPFGANSFSDLCGVLAKFDALAQEIKKHAA